MSEILKYRDTIEILMDDARAVWLTVPQIMELLDITDRNIRLHYSNWKEFDAEAAEKGRREIAMETAGGKQAIIHYNVDFLIYIAYRMNQKEVNDRVKAFRQWVASIVDRYLRGDLRAREKATYEDVRNFITQMVDYDPNSSVTREYFATIQNKLLYAITSRTAAEIIVERANHRAPNMGLQTWGNKGITQDAAIVAKNYLKADELAQLSEFVGILAFAARRYKIKGATSAQWVKYVDEQIELYMMQVLIGKGRYSAEYAKDYAKREYGKFKAALASGER